MLFHSHSVPSQRRGWRIVRVLVCLALLLHGLLPLAAVAREPVEALPTRPNQPTQQLTSAEPLQPAAINAPQAVGIVATKRDAFATDADSDGLGDANDVVRYTVIITNTGSTDATGVAFNDTLDDDSALVAGSVRVSPLARPDVFNTVGNTQLLVGIAQPANVPALAVAGNLFTNDSEFLGDTFSLQSFSATSANGGTVVVNAAGTFSYLPPVGFTGTDTFNYTIVDGGGLTSVGTVTITVANRVWYVNNAGANGDGRSTTPFNTLALAQAASAINDVIFVHTGSGNYASITLKNGQQLIGRGVALIVGGNTLLAAGTAPTLSATGTLVTLAQNNTVRGMTITSQTSGLGISGTSFGTATINAVALNGGPALSLTTGTLNGDFSTLSSSGGAFGVALTSVNGKLTATAGTISGISGTDFLISAGTIAVTYPGAIGFGGAINDTGTGILIQNNTSGTISLSNASKTFNTGANPAITMITNTGATVEFTGGGLSVTTSSGTGMNITGGGTLRVSGTGNSITSTAGQAINMVNTTSGGITFQSVSANISGGIGITLNMVGTGGFTVTGTGTTDGSGGTIQNTNRGIEISSASNISLSNMTLANANQANGGTCDSSSNTGCNAAINLDAVTTVALTNVDITNVNQIGINGVNVAAFSLSNSVIQNCGNEGSEGCLRFSNLSGTSSISGSNLALKPVAGSAYNGERVVWIVNTSGTLNLTVSSSTFRDTGNSTNPGNGLEVFLRLTAIATINVSNSSFLRIGTIGLQVNTSDSSSASATVSGSTFDFDTAAFGRGVEFASSQTSTLNFRVNTSTIKGKGGVALVVVTGNTASSNGFIQNNTIIGTVGGFGSALLVRSSDQSRIKVEISDNIIDKQGADNGIFIDNGTANTTHTSRIDAIVLRNTITTNTLASNGINITALINQTICANVANNVVTELGTGGGGGQLSAFRGRASAPGATLYLQGFNTNVATTWINNGNTPANAARVIQSGTGTIAAPPGGACTPPTAFRPAGALAPSAESVVASDADAASEPAQTVDAATLAPNEPASAPAATNAPTVAARPAALLADTVPLSIGTLPAGLKITIIFDAVIEDPLVTTSSTLSNQASISGTNFSTVLSNDPDTVAANDPTLTPLDLRSGLTLSKSDGGASVVPGGVVAYSLTITNTITRPALTTVLTETVPVNTTFNAGASSVGWSCADGASAGTTCTLAVGNLVGNTTVTRTFAVRVVNPVAAGVSQISNTATVGDNASIADLTPADNTATDTTPVNAAPDLRISKTDGGVSVAPGGTVVYTLSYTNTGNQGATGISLSETVPANTTFTGTGWICLPSNNVGSVCTRSVGALAGGGANGSATFTLTVINPVAAGVNQISNTATVSDDGANGADPNPANNTGSDTTPLNAAPALTLRKSDGGTTAIPGGTIVYTLSYTNTGNQGASGITLSETVPANTIFNPGASSAGWVCAPNANAGATCTLAVGALAAGGNVSRTFAVTVINAVPAGVSQISNTASVSDDGSNSAAIITATASDTTPLAAAPDLRISKSDGGATTTPGGTIVYTLNYTNTGNQGATGVVLSETVPANTTFNAGASSAGWSCATGSPAGTSCTLSVGGLNAGNSGSRTFAVTVVNPIAAGVSQISNTATIADDGANGADPTPANNSASDTTPITAAPDLALTKSDGGVSAAPGDTINYTLTITNTGNQGATGVGLSETVPANTTFNPGASTAGWVCLPNTNAGATCTLAVGAVTTNVSAVFAVSVVNPVPAGVSQISNTASVADDGTNGADPTPANNSAADTTPLAITLDLSISKTVTPSVANAGDTITYTLRFTSTGDTLANGVRITDTLPSQITFVGSSTSGAPITQINGAPTLVWNADNLQPGATGIITLTATVNANVTTEQDVVNRVSIAHSQETAPANNSDSATFTINLAPTANAGGPYTVNEGATVVLTGAASTDPGNDPLIFAWDLDNNGAYETSGITVTFTNTADDAVYTVGLRVTDTEGATAATTTTITVQNIAPIVNAGADRSARPNEVVTFSGAFTDPGVLDTHTIAWDFGDGGTTSGTLSPTHTYVNSGSYTVTLTITDDDDGVGVDTLRVNVRSGKVYLPLVLMMRPAALPDLVVQNISTTGTSISVVIKNEGTAPVTQALWVDLYFNPNPAPTTVNQIWQALGQYGMVWAVTGAALPLQPGQSLTLVSRDAYFRSDLSAFLAPIPVGTKVYVQVDSANDLTTYGAVLETHEASGGAYNNITGPFITTQAISIPPAAAAVERRPDATLPQRPTAPK